MPERGRHPLFARGAEECRPPGGGASLRRSARERGPFRDVSDFARRINPRRRSTSAPWRRSPLPARSTSFGIDRATAFANVDRIIAAGNRSAGGDRRRPGRSLLRRREHVPPPIELRPAKPWVPTDRLSREFEAVGFFLTGHPLDDYKDVLEALGAETVGGVRRQGAPSPRGRHARRHRASCARAQGQDRQSLRFRRLLGPDRPIRGGGVFRGARWPPGLCLSRDRGSARCRGRGRRRERQGQGAALVLARPGGRSAPCRHEDLSSRILARWRRLPSRSDRAAGRGSSASCFASTTSRARSSSCCRKASTRHRSRGARSSSWPGLRRSARSDGDQGSTSPSAGLAKAGCLPINRTISHAGC